MGILKPPTKADRAAGLPTSKQEAIDRRLTRFISDGEEWVIRNYGSATAPEGRLARAANRKATRGAGPGSRRERNETLSTPPWADRNAFGEAMHSANRQNMEGHHATPIYLTGNALAEMSPSRQMQYHLRMRAAGVDIGNQSGNVIPLAELPHDEAHREGDALQNWLKAKDGSIHINAIMTRANMPALGGFKDAEIGPYQTPQRAEQPAQTPPQETYTPPEQPLEPKRDLTQQIYEMSEAVVPAVVGAAATGLSFLGGAVKFVTGGGF